MTEKLMFGRPGSVEQAMLRLPTFEHPDYKIWGGPIEHLVHLNEHLSQLMIKSLDGGEPPLCERWVPLELEDMKVLERFSFRRKLEKALTVQWKFIRRSSQWELFFPVGSDCYKWWQISEMTPELELPSLTLVCVESNSRFIFKGAKYHFDKSSEFDLLLLNSREITSLKEELTRQT